MSYSKFSGTSYRGQSRESLTRFLTYIYRFSTLGTPNEEVWPGVTHLPDYQAHFPVWEARNLTEVIPEADPLAIDLISVRSSSFS